MTAPSSSAQCRSTRSRMRALQQSLGHSGRSVRRAAHHGVPVSERRCSCASARQQIRRQSCRYRAPDRTLFHAGRRIVAAGRRDRRERFGDKAHRRSGALLLMSVGQFAMVASDSWGWQIAGRLIAGAGGVLAQMCCCTQDAHRLVSPARRSQPRWRSSSIRGRPASAISLLTLPAIGTAYGVSAVYSFRSPRWLASASCCLLLAIESPRYDSRIFGSHHGSTATTLFAVIVAGLIWGLLQHRLRDDLQSSAPPCWSNVAGRSRRQASADQHRAVARGVRLNRPADFSPIGPRGRNRCLSSDACLFAATDDGAAAIAACGDPSRDHDRPDQRPALGRPIMSLCPPASWQPADARHRQWASSTPSTTPR